MNGRPVKAGRRVKAADTVAIHHSRGEALRGDARGDPPDDPLRGRLAAGHRQAGGDGRPSGGRPSGRDAGQRPPPPLPGPLGDRRRPSPRDRPPSRQGDLRPARGGQIRCGPSGAGRAVQAPRGEKDLPGPRLWGSADRRGQDRGGRGAAPDGPQKDVDAEPAGPVGGDRLARPGAFRRAPRCWRSISKRDGPTRSASI